MTIFNESTPHEILKKYNPHIKLKEGDYVESMNYGEGAIMLAMSDSDIKDKSIKFVSAMPNFIRPNKSFFGGDVFYKLKKVDLYQVGGELTPSNNLKFVSDLPLHGGNIYDFEITTTLFSCNFVCHALINKNGQCSLFGIDYTNIKFMDSYMPGSFFKQLSQLFPKNKFNFLSTISSDEASKINHVYFDCVIDKSEVMEYRKLAAFLNSVFKVRDSQYKIKGKGLDIKSKIKDGLFSLKSGVKLNPSKIKSKIRQLKQK